MDSQGKPLNVRTLQRFYRLEELGTDQLADLAEHLVVMEAKRGASIIELGSMDDTTLYLLKGQVRLTAEDGKVKYIDAKDAAARHPISRLRPSHQQVTAVTAIEYLVIDNDALDGATGFEEPSSLLLRHDSDNDHGLYLVSEQDNSLVIQIYEDLNHDRLSIPSLQEIGEKIGRALLRDSIDQQTVSKLLMADPALTVKALRKHHHPIQQDNNCAGPLKEISLSFLRPLLVRSLFRDSIRQEPALLHDILRNWWERSIAVSAAARFLAALNKDLHPQCAALAGLLHAIGEVVIIGYSREYTEWLTKPALLQQLISDSSREIGSIVLRMWNFPPELVNVVAEAGNWHRARSNNAADYTDVVLMAQYYVAAQTGNKAQLPLAEQLPSYHALAFAEQPSEFFRKLEETIKKAASDTLAGLDAAA